MAVLGGHTAEVRLAVSLSTAWVGIEKGRDDCSNLETYVYHNSYYHPLEKATFVILVTIYTPQVSSVHWSVTRQEQLVLSSSWDNSVRLVI